MTDNLSGGEQPQPDLLQQIELLEQRDTPPTLGEIYVLSRAFVDRYAAPSEPDAFDPDRPDRRTPPVPAGHPILDKGKTRECVSYFKDGDEEYICFDIFLEKDIWSAWPDGIYGQVYRIRRSDSKLFEKDKELPEEDKPEQKIKRHGLYDATASMLGSLKRHLLYFEGQSQTPTPSPDA